MSLVEAALNKAKKLVETARHPVLKPERRTERRRALERQPEFDAGAIAARAAQARVLPVARVDAQTMERHGVLLQVSDTAAHRAYRILRTRIQQLMQVEGWSSFAVTAAGAGEGKTLTALNVAISLARDVNTWVYVVDCDLQRPMLASYLGMKFDKGLSDYLAGDARFEEILYSPGVERLAVIPNAQAMEHSSDALGSARMRGLCQLLAAEVPRPIVIFDMPPLLMGDDVLKFGPSADSILLVVAEGVARRGLLERAYEELQGMNLLGIALNRSAEREAAPGYY